MIGAYRRKCLVLILVIISLFVLACIPADADYTFGNYITFYEYNTTMGENPDIARNGTTNYYVIATTGSAVNSEDLIISTTTINDATGVVTTPFIDTWTVETGNQEGSDPDIECVDSTTGMFICAYAFRDDVAVTKYLAIFTFSINSDGTINKAKIDTLNNAFGTELWTANSYVNLLHMGGDAFVVQDVEISTYDGFIQSFTADATGSISNAFVETIEYDTSSGYNNWACKIDSNTFLLTCKTSGSDGMLYTYNCDSSGDMTFVDSWKFSSGSVDYCFCAPTQTSDIFIFAYKETTINFKTIKIASSGVITKSVISSFAYTSASAEAPHITYLKDDMFAWTISSTGSKYMFSMIISDTGIINSNQYGAYDLESTAGTGARNYYHPVIININTTSSANGRPNILAIVNAGPSEDGYIHTVYYSLNDPCEECPECNSTDLTMHEDIINATGTHESSYDPSTGWSVWANYTGNNSLNFIEDLANCTGTYQTDWNGTAWTIWLNYTGYNELSFIENLLNLTGAHAENWNGTGWTIWLNYTGNASALPCDCNSTNLTLYEFLVNCTGWHNSSYNSTTGWSVWANYTGNGSACPSIETVIITFMDTYIVYIIAVILLILLALVGEWKENELLMCIAGILSMYLGIFALSSEVAEFRAIVVIIGVVFIFRGVLFALDRVSKEKDKRHS